jgi:RHS repeat-associated protein
MKVGDGKMRESNHQTAKYGMMILSTVLVLLFCFSVNAQGLSEQEYSDQARQALMPDSIGNLSEEQLYEYGEYFRLKHDYCPGIAAFKKLLEKYPGSSVAAEVDFKAGLMMLYTGSQQWMDVYKEGLEWLKGVRARRAGTEYAGLADLYIEAVENPTDIADLDIWLEIFEHGKIYGETYVQAYFGSRAVWRMVKAGICDEIRASSTLTDRQKENYLIHVAFAVFMSGDNDVACQLFEEIAGNPSYCEENKAYALLMKGHIEHLYHEDIESAMNSWLAIYDQYTGSTRGDDALWVIGRMCESRDYLETARMAYQALLENYPESEYAGAAANRKANLEEKLGELASANPEEPGQATAAVKRWREILGAKKGDIQLASCGAITLERVCEKLGVKVSRDEAVSLCRGDRDGANTFAELALGFSRKGLTSIGGRISTGRLQSLSKDEAAVLHYRARHFVVYEGREGNRVRLYNGEGTFSVSTEEFQREWDRYALLVSRSAAQKELALGEGARPLSQIEMGVIRGTAGNGGSELPPDPNPADCNNTLHDPVCVDADCCDEDQLSEEDAGFYNPHLSVNTTWGNSVNRENDLSLPTKGAMGIGIDRSYSSWVQISTAGGSFATKHWALKYDERLYQNEDDLMLLDEKFRKRYFAPKGTNQWVSKTKTGTYRTIIGLLEEPPQYYQITEHSGMKKYFNHTSGYLTKIQSPAGNSVTLYRDANNLITKIQGDGTNQSIELMNDGTNKRLTKIRGINNNLGGLEIEYMYDQDNVLTKTAWKNGANTLKSVEYQYSQYNLSKISVNGAPFRYMYYDVVNWPYQMTKIEDHNGNSTMKISIGDEFSLTPTITKYYTGSKTVKIEPYFNQARDATKKVFTYGGNTVTKNFYYAGNDAHNGRLSTKETISNQGYGRPMYATKTEAQATFSEWRGMNNVTKNEVVHDGVTKTYTYEYESNFNRRTKTTYPDNYTQYAYYDSTKGTLTKSTDRAGVHTTYQYNSYSQLTKQSLDPTGLNYRSEYYYNDNTGMLTKMKSACTACGYGGATEYEYDSRGNVTTIRAGLSTDPKTEYSYDLLNRATKVRSPYGNPGSPSYAEVTYEYGPVNLTKVTDPASKNTYLYHDGSGQMTKVKDAINGETTYSYDLQGDLTKVVDARSKATQYDYDELGRLTREKGELNDERFYYYNEYNNLTKSLIAYKNIPGVGTGYQHAEYYYDDLNRLTRLTKSQAGVSDGTVSFYYNDLNSLTKRIDGMGTFEYTYDVMQRVTTAEYYDNSRLRYWYNNAGQRTKLEYKDNGSNVYSGIEYSYDDGGRLTKIHWQPYLHCFDYTDIDSTYDYDEANRVTKRTVEGVSWYEAEDSRAKVATTYQYDAAGRVTRLILDNDDNPIDLDDRDFAYYYDSRGNRTKTVLNNDANKKIEYFYDDLNRLTKEQRSGTSTNYTYQYSYDAVGNRTQMVKDGTTTTYAYDDENRLRTKTTGGVNTTYEYSYNGILTKEYKDANNYRYFYWDSLDHLTKVEKKVSGNTTTVEYKYDANGRRVQKVKDGNTTRYVYDGLKVAIEQVNNNNPLLYFNDFSAVGGMLARYNAASADPKVSRVYAYDVIGNVVGYLESDMPYGYGTGTSFVQEAFGNVRSGSQAAYHLTTKEYDADSELYYFNARWYDSESGRWLSKETLSVIDRYDFCINNPVSFVDKDGLAPIWQGEDLDWPECTIEELLRHARCCDLGNTLSNLINNIFRILFINQVPLEPPPGTHPNDVCGGVTVGCDAYFNPRLGDSCTQLCACLHEYVHVLQNYLGIPREPRSGREFPAYAVGAVCNFAMAGILTQLSNM